MRSSGACREGGESEAFKIPHQRTPNLRASRPPVQTRPLEQERTRRARGLAVAEDQTRSLMPAAAIPVSLHVYDATNTPNDTANNAIQRLNGVTREVGFGVFHGAVEVLGLEWSFGFCENGTGVYGCQPKGNSMYSYRETILLGVTALGPTQVREAIAKMQAEWPGRSYDLLQRNCCHFCESFCGVLGVTSPPAWVNRFAKGADAAVGFTNYSITQVKQITSDVSWIGVTTFEWLRDAVIAPVLETVGVLDQNSAAGAAGGGQVRPPGQQQGQPGTGAPGTGAGFGAPGAGSGASDTAGVAARA